VQRAWCDFAAKLTLTPGEMGPVDLEKLRALGITDEQIHIAAQVCGYFNYINRIADALGVDNEAWMTMPRDEWFAKKGKNYGL